MNVDEQAAMAQMLMGVRMQLGGMLQQVDGLLRLLAKDAKPEDKSKRLPFLGENEDGN